MFKNTRAQIVIALSVFVSAALPTRQALAEDFDAGVENEAVMADSEGAIAEAAEQKKLEQADRDRYERAQKQAKAEAVEAKKSELDAKAKIAKSMIEEARLKKEKAAADVRRQVATDRIKQTETELQARQTQLDVLKELTDKTVADRDQLEQKVKANEEKMRRLEFQIANEIQRKKDSESSLNLSKTRMAKAQSQVREASNRLSTLQKNRAPSSIGGISSGSRPSNAAIGAAAPQQGWVKLKKDCGLNAAADQTSSTTQILKSGDRIYGRKFDDKWIEVRDRAAASPTGYLAITCVK